MPVLFRDFFRNIIACYRGRNLLWQALAVVFTIAIVLSGFDWTYYTLTRDATLQDIAFFAVGLGSFMPILLPIALVLIGISFKKARLTLSGWATGQSALLGFGISSLYKVFTGRLPPPHTALADVSALTDTSHGFQFGFLRGGAFWGWPSSHTATAFAVATCLIVMYPKNKAVAIPMLLYALYTGLGVSMTIHWFSEFVAGAIVGSVVGMVVGKSFRKTA